jgi:proline iminopeptidase
MRQFYPAIRPYASHRVDVAGGHALYVEECGIPEGVPVLFVHGGPGAGCSEQDRRFFDPEKYRIILFDQRGAGRSRPHADLNDNTTAHLLADMETLREKLGVERWLLFGGSWGSTLSLLYAQAHPERVLGLVLRGIFLCRKTDIDWFYRYGASCIFPDYWQDFIGQIPAEEHQDLLHAYHRRLTGDNDITRMAAAKAWASWEARCATHEPNGHVVARFGSPQVALAMARIAAHYFVNDAFIAADQICRDAHRLANIPTVIVHGRYDVVCPVDQAFTLQQALPHAELDIIRDAGHASSEPGTLDALIRATDRFAGELAGKF